MSKVRLVALLLAISCAVKRGFPCRDRGIRIEKSVPRALLVGGGAVGMAVGIYLAGVAAFQQ